MMSLEDIIESWNKDCQIDSYELGNESLNTPVLHNKYSKILLTERVLLAKLEQQYNALLKDKSLYYLGYVDPKEVVVRGWQPLKQKILKQDLSLYINADVDLSDLKVRLTLQQEKITYLESILKTILNRGFYIKNALEARRLQAGFD